MADTIRIEEKSAYENSYGQELVPLPPFYMRYLIKSSFPVILLYSHHLFIDALMKRHGRSLEPMRYSGRLGDCLFLSR